MKKNIYFSKFIRRENLLQKFLLNMFIGFASYPRLTLEVFIRRNFGERYINMASIITVAFLMAITPVIFQNFREFLFYGLDYVEWDGFWSKYMTWYMFLAAFLYYGIRRRMEFKRSKSSFDFDMVTTYAGDIDPRFMQIRPFNTSPTIRKIETLYEPGLFFLIGLVLFMVGQRLGLFLIITSIFYSLSYVGTYWQGDNYIMDQIDIIKYNEEMFRIFVDDVPPQDAKGVRFYGNKPSSRELREKIVSSFFEDDDDAVEVG